MPLYSIYFFYIYKTVLPTKLIWPGENKIKHILKVLDNITKPNEVSIETEK